MRVYRYIDIYHVCISSPCYPVKACEKAEPHGPTVWCACMKELSSPISRICIISHKFIGLLFVLWPLLSGHDELLEYGAASASHQVSVCFTWQNGVYSECCLFKQMDESLSRCPQACILIMSRHYAVGWRYDSLIFLKVWNLAWVVNETVGDVVKDLADDVIWIGMWASFELGIDTLVLPWHGMALVSCFGSSPLQKWLKPCMQERYLVSKIALYG